MQYSCWILECYAPDEQGLTTTATRPNGLPCLVAEVSWLNMKRGKISAMLVLVSLSRVADGVQDKGLPLGEVLAGINM
jgi:hypothetical protein